MKKALILHGWFGKPSECWYPNIKKHLEDKGYIVHIPQLSDPEKPTLHDWTNCALKDFTIDSDTTIIGHSLGCALALKLVENSNCKIDTLITVSGWDYWDLTPEHETFFADKFNYEKIINNSQHRYAFHSTNDPYVTIFVAEEYSKRIKGNFIKIENGGHLGESDKIYEFPELAKILN